MPVFAAISAALERGVRVSIVADVFSRSRMTRESGRSWSEHRKIVKQTNRVLKQLRQEGAHVSLFGHLGLNPFKGRCHVKITVIDDLVFSFGGINFTSGSFRSADYMLSTEHVQLADMLCALAEKIATDRPPLADMEIELDTKNMVLFDGGVPGKSVIYERCVELARRATHIYYVSQMVPSGSLAQVLKGVPYDAYFNRPSQSGFFLKLSLYVDGFINKVTNLYKRDRFIHAKCILFELDDGTKAIVSGSNNFSWRGIVYGTQEIALYSTDPALWQQLYEFLRTTLA
jgi:hypothetical protein